MVIQLSFNMSKRMLMPWGWRVWSLEMMLCSEEWRSLSELPEVDRILVILACSMVWPGGMASGVEMCGYRSAREIGSDGSDMIGEACGQSSFGLPNIGLQHLAALADNGIDQIPRGAGKWRGYVMTNPVRTGNFNCEKNMRTCFASGTFAFGSARWKLRITCTNNAVSNVTFTTKAVI